MREANCAQACTAVRRTEAPCAQASIAVRFSARSALRAGYWPTCLTDGHMVVNDHTRSAENWKCVVLHSSDRWQQCVHKVPLHAYSVDGTTTRPNVVFILVYMSFVSIRYYKAVLYAALHSYNLFVTWQHTSDYTLTGITYIHIYNNITYIYIYYRVYVDSHSLGQLALASKRTANMLYIDIHFNILRYSTSWLPCQRHSNVLQ